MNLKAFKKFRNENNLLFGFLITNEQALINVTTKPNKTPPNREYADEVKKYRTERFTCHRTGSVISKLKINL